MSSTSNGKTLFENDQIRVYTSDWEHYAATFGRFATLISDSHTIVAVLENKKPYSLVIVPLNGNKEMAFEPFLFEPEDSDCLCSDIEADQKLLNAAKAGAIACFEPERWAEVDEKFGTSFAGEYDEELDRWDR